MSETTYQFDYMRLLDRLAALVPAPALMGGFADDALLCGKLTRVHADTNLLIPRPELPSRLEQFSTLGFTTFATLFEEAPGRPLVLQAIQGGLSLELGVANVSDDGVPWFELPGFVVRLPRDTFGYPPVLLEGRLVRTISPLSLYQMRAAFLRTGAFGSPRPHDLASQARLRERFWPGTPEQHLSPDMRPHE